MAVVGLIAGEGEHRARLKLAAEELGHRVVPLSSLRQAPDLLRKVRPQVWLSTDRVDGVEGVVLVRELIALTPLVPVVVALERRNAGRAVELMRAGAADCVAPPWTPEAIRSVLKKALRFRGTSLEVVRPKERFRRALFYWASAAVFFGAALSLVVLNRRERLREEASRVTREWDLPYSHPSGLAFDGKELWVADWFGQAVYRHEPARMEVVRLYHFPRAGFSALTFAERTLWSATEKGVVQRHLMDGRLPVVTRLDVLKGRRVVGLAFDGLYFWSLEAGGRKLRKHLPDAEWTVLDAYDYPGSKPAALVYARNALWSLDEGNRELLQHDLDRPGEILFRAPLKEYQSGQWKPVGLAWDGRSFLTAAEGKGSGRVFRHSVALRHED